MIEFTIPWPPTTNTYYRNVQGKTLISREGRSYKRNISQIVSRNHFKKATGRLEVVLVCYPPDRRKRDLDNLLKAIFDSLQKAGVYDDDSQIDRIVMQREKVSKGGFVHVFIRSWENVSYS